MSATSTAGTLGSARRRRLAHVAKDGTPRAIPIAFVWNGTEVVVVTPTWAKLIDLEHTLPTRSKS
jgi:hypothetical protein